MHAHRWSAGRTRGRALAAALSLGVLASSLMLAAPASPVLAGTETGACTLEAVDSFGGPYADSIVAVPFEQVEIRGTGWLPLSQPNVDYGGFMHWEGAPQMLVTAAGSTSVGVASDRHYGTFVVRVSQAAPACVQEVTITILPIADMNGYWFHTQAIEWLYMSGITSGCAPDLFCPGGLLTRGQMASFLTRALGLPATSTDYFTDDETNKHEANINRLREADITFGCAPGLFCPNGLVTRAQMASFLVRARDLPATSTDYFLDDEGNTHEANINSLRAAGITFGCGGFATTFCPNGLVTRAQMASFLYRALN
ncbi:MAG TPA: S-layer homology domain-containing protein [Candidatus Limnocylindria bacterium]